MMENEEERDNKVGEMIVRRYGKMEEEEKGDSGCWRRREEMRENCEIERR